MTIINSVSSASVLALTFVASACAQQTTERAEPIEAAKTDTKKVALGPAVQTVKPGALVTISSDITQGLNAGDTGFASITLNEGYPYGTLSVVATGGDGLAVLGGDASVQFDMSDRTTHTWRVDFETLSDGVHYLNLMTKADVEAGFSQSRAHAIRIEVGDWKSVQAAREATKLMTTMSTGESAVVLEAQETIE
ncbi:MAG: hypothetical protein AAFV59_15910 [Pseudomonadota bacterium]